MNKTIVKIFILFTLSAAAIATVLLGINFLGIAYISSDAAANIYKRSPKRTLDLVAEELTPTDGGFTLEQGLVPDEDWCILIDESGEVIWSEHMPGDIPTHYSINDVARMTRWFISDYPVYVRTTDSGLLVLGVPKNSVSKYSIEYSMNWFESLPWRILLVLMINICLAALLACIAGLKLYRKLRKLCGGIQDLQREKPVRLLEKGVFKEISKAVNSTSDAIERKNAALAARDSARANWINGISHDIRTPLSVIVGYSEELAKSEADGESRRKAEIITAQSIKIKKLIDDLNLISSLEYDMQPSKRQAVRICPLLRRVAADIVNSGLSDKFEINLDLRSERAEVLGDDSLLERAVFNLINNSIAHNKNGCAIQVIEYLKGTAVCVEIKDNGSGAPSEVLDSIAEMPKSAHGLGLPMAYKIISVHGGTFSAWNDWGMKVRIELPSA
ncbi:MAG: HAMP domain-containing histidine kinase [Oscillospiraceae bacterium]|nr:HAMP domain-containing histidine kinase [Oscillospiraceae bacterium]